MLIGANTSPQLSGSLLEFADLFNGVFVLAITARTIASRATSRKPALHFGGKVKLRIGCHREECRNGISKLFNGVFEERLVVHANVVSNGLVYLTRFFSEVAGGLGQRLRVDDRKHLLVPVARRRSQARVDNDPFAVFCPLTFAPAHWPVAVQADAGKPLPDLIFHVEMKAVCQPERLGECHARVVADVFNPTLAHSL